MEPLSQPLADWLFKLNLCTRADLRHCRGRVRQLARDVPVFDSVWIDALVHARKLTPFQAGILESGHPDQLAVGPCVLVDQLGRGQSVTYLASHRDNRQRCVLKLIELPDEQRGPALEALQHLIRRVGPLSHSSIVAPQSCLGHQRHLVTVSPFLPGPTLSQLLVRRGRFPSVVVLAIARQLIDGLAALEQCGVVHGDVRLQNLRLNSTGDAVLVDAGILPAVRPELNYYARISPDRYDGIAPELVGTGQTPDVQSDFYALGCLLWQLLAGRPTFPTGDPLAKLMSHRTRRIPDVRDVAPETPAELADIVRTWTDPDPARRPPSFRAFRERWGPARPAHRRQLKRFRSRFNTAIPYVPAMRPEEPAGRWPMVSALLFVLCGAALSLMDAGAYSELLAIPRKWAANLHPPVAEASDALDGQARAGDESTFLPLPPPNADGVIELPTEGPYRFSQIHSVGSVTLRGSATKRPQILLSDTPCLFSAEQVILENVHFRQAASAPANKLPALVEIQSRTLVVRGCVFELGSSESPRKNSVMPAAVRWRHVDQSHPTGGQLEIENCLMTGLGTGLHLETLPRLVTVTNCLKSGAGPFLNFAETNRTPSSRDVQLRVAQLTLRGATAFLRREPFDPALDQPAETWLIQAEHCVFDLPAEAAAVFQFVGPEFPSRFFEQLQLRGQDCLLAETAQVAAWVDPATGQNQPVDPASLSLEGLVLGRFSFAGSRLEQPEDSLLKTWQGPRHASSSPGIQLEKLPAGQGSRVKRQGPDKTGERGASAL